MRKLAILQEHSNLSWHQDYSRIDEQVVFDEEIREDFRGREPRDIEQMTLQIIIGSLRYIWRPADKIPSTKFKTS